MDESLSGFTTFIRYESKAMDSATSFMRNLHRAAEPDCLNGLVQKASTSADARHRILARASGLLAELRRAQ